MARLIVSREEADLVTHELTRDVITIGSAPLNHIVIERSRGTEQHAILARVGASYWLKDLRSTNGTQVNGVSISDAELKNGDKIQFGTVPSILARKGYKFSTPRGIAFAQTLGNHYGGVDDDQGRVFNNMNKYERANLALIRAIEKDR